MKTFSKFFYLLIMAFTLFVSCEGDPVISDESISLVEEAKFWFESQSKQIDKLPLKIDWDQSKQSGDNIYVPISRSEKVFINESSFLKITKEDGIFQASIKLALTDSLATKKSSAIDLNGSDYINFDLNGQISELSLPTESLISKTSAQLTSRSGCSLVGVYLNVTYTDGSTDKILLYTYIECAISPDETIDPGDGNGGGGATNPENLTTGPSCKSFNFRNTTGLWQEAAVTGIHMNIILIHPVTGVKKANTISFPQPILFGLPSNYTLGGGLTAGSAAELSALILRKTMSDIASQYGNKMAHNSFVAIKFREKLISNYKSYTGGGGRVQFNYTGSIPPSPYRTELFGTGNCN